MLLTLGKKEFPVDTNVGRICARCVGLSLPLLPARGVQELATAAPPLSRHSPAALAPAYPPLTPTATCRSLGWLPLESEQSVEDLDDYAPEPEVHAYLRARCGGGCGCAGGQGGTGGVGCGGRGGAAHGRLGSACRAGTHLPTHPPTVLTLRALQHTQPPTPGRLLGFDVEALYELHYQMITLGKVFCNKQQPNWCGATAR